MSIIRSIDSFSLPELFKLIGNNSRSGRAIVETPISQATTKRGGIYYIWFQNGYLIAISNSLNQKGLIELIAQRKWLNQAIVSRLRKLCPTGVPLGAYLERMKLLNKEQLNLVFQLQLYRVYRLFQLTDGRLRFDDFSELQDRILTVPWLEMTGHRIEARIASMNALRLMENSPSLSDRLPAPNQILTRLAREPRLKLTTIERRVWDLADSKTCLWEMSEIILRPLQEIQAAAFRLITVGLLEAVFVSDYSWTVGNKMRTAIAIQSDRLSSQF